MVADKWPLPSEYRADRITTNPAWKSAAALPRFLAGAGSVGALLAVLLCIVGVLGATRKRVAFLGLSVLVAGLTFAAFGVYFGFTYGQ